MVKEKMKPYARSILKPAIFRVHHLKSYPLEAQRDSIPPTTIAIISSITLILLLMLVVWAALILRKKKVPIMPQIAKNYPNL